ncbi:MAG TPA: SLBB domain-containing protein [Patescibacteria group bacterium]
MFEDTHLSFHLPALLSRLDRMTLVLTAVLASGLVCVVYGLSHLFLLSQAKVQANPGEILGVSSVASSIYVDVSGAVVQPGVYQLQAGDRVAAALEKAGGLSVEADTVFVAQTLNLAEKVVDGQKLYIPWMGEAKAVETQSKDSTSSTSGLVSINEASQSELESLPQIGEKRAAEIIQNRPYGSVAELVDKGVLTQSQLDEINVLISL